MALKMEARRAWGYSRKAAGGARLSLVHNEVHWLNPVPRGIRVLSGVAWITLESEDIVLNPGQAIRFSPGRSHPLISAVGPGTLTVEMLN